MTWIALPTGQPRMRREWRLRHAAHIRKKTGIATLSDLRDFDFASFMATHFLREEIDDDRFGRWINRIPLRAHVVTHHPSGFTYNHALRAAYLHGRLYEIASPAELRQHLREEQEKIRTKRGRRTVEEEKYAS
jgi:hypothetical protein